MTTQYQMLMTE